MIKKTRTFLHLALAIIFLASGNAAISDNVAKKTNPLSVKNTIWHDAKKRVPLFAYFPSLAKKTSYLPLGLLPTPLENHPELAQKLGLKSFLLKRDDLAGSLFGGNKVRKLEFLLSEATNQGADRVVTWGWPGSPHTTATAIYCHNLGLACTCMYLPNKNHTPSQDNLKLTKDHGADEEMYRGHGERELALYKKNNDHRQATGKSMYFVPESGADVLGALGFVNAACELVAQCKEQQLEIPEIIYLLTNSAASAAGFLVGLDLLCIKTAPVLVALNADEYPDQQQSKIEKLYAAIMQYISHVSLGVRTYKEPQNIILYKHGFTPPSHQALVQNAQETQSLAQKICGYRIDPIYATRLWAAFLLDCQDNNIANKRILLWNTGQLLATPNTKS
jgi:1-aminocyclopropane-1-carboxylate deaminase/D-cysteine desulfhydrase-like pyridoxal-dependent ACC family enzyme